jgi:peptidoglycan/xylan/chitin deacetylase (PgdA/CDA1 family)
MNLPRPVPILLYHKVAPVPAGARVPGHYVSAALFRRHLTFLSRRGYKSVSLLDLVRSDAKLPRRPAVITFDDGYRCVREHALPALVEAGWIATVFLVSGAIGGTNIWERPAGDVEEALLGACDIADMQGAGIEFGSHTVTHPHLTGLPPAEVARELGDSRRRVEDLTGAPCLSVAYPYGDWDRVVRDLAAEAGYAVGCTTRRAAARREDDPLALPRINIRRYNVIPRFAYKLWRAERVRR